MSNLKVGWIYASADRYVEGVEVKVPSGQRGVVGSPPEPQTGRVYVRGIGWYGTSQLRIKG